jgi:hypothetical protein
MQFGIQNLYFSGTYLLKYTVTSEKAAILVQKVIQKTAFCFKKSRNHHNDIMEWYEVNINSTKKNALY